MVLNECIKGYYNIKCDIIALFSPPNAFLLFIVIIFGQYFATIFGVCMVKDSLYEWKMYFYEMICYYSFIIIYLIGLKMILKEFGVIYLACLSHFCDGFLRRFLGNILYILYLVYYYPRNDALYANKWYFYLMICYY